MKILVLDGLDRSCLLKLYEKRPKTSLSVVSCPFSMFLDRKRFQAVVCIWVEWSLFSMGFLGF